MCADSAAIGGPDTAAAAAGYGMGAVCGRDPSRAASTERCAPHPPCCGGCANARAAVRGDGTVSGRGTNMVAVRRCLVGSGPLRTCAAAWALDSCGRTCVRWPVGPPNRLAACTSGAARIMARTAGDCVPGRAAPPLALSGAVVGRSRGRSRDPADARCTSAAGSAVRDNHCGTPPEVPPPSEWSQPPPGEVSPPAPSGRGDVSPPELRLRGRRGDGDDAWWGCWCWCWCWCW